MKTYAQVEAPRGTPLQAIAGWGAALAAGAAFWGVVLPPVLDAARDALAGVLEVMWP